MRVKQLTAMDVAYGRRTSVSPTHVNPAIKGTKHRYRCLAFMHDPSYYRSQAERARRLALVPTDRGTQNTLLQMAQDYLDLVEDLESGAIEIRHPELMPQNRHR